MIFLLAYMLAALAGIGVVLLGARLLQRRREREQRRIARLEQLLRELPAYPPGLEPKPGWQQRVIDAVNKEPKP